jgi:Tfp pilus assembly ATPase PilU
LFADYDKLERPVEIDTESLNVTLALSLQQIVDVVSIFEKENESLCFFY